MDIYSVIMITVIVPLITSTITNLLTVHLPKIVQDIKIWWTCRRNGYRRVVLESTSGCNGVGYNVTNSTTEPFIQGLLYIISKNNANASKLNCTPVSGGMNSKDYLTLIPNNEPITVDEFTLTVSTVQKLNDPRDSKNDMRIVNTITVTIESMKSTAEIQQFISNCCDQRLSMLKNDNPQYFYTPITSSRSSKDMVKYEEYVVRTTMSWNELFIPHKSTIMRLIDNLNTGRLKNLTLLLSGVPGCGKTSLIKTIITALKYPVIGVKLSLLNDIELFKLLHAKILCNNKVDPIRSKRIFLLEDVDAETDVVFRRNSKVDLSVHLDIKSKSRRKSKETSTSVLRKPMPKVTLSGLLNALDGAMELPKSVVILTTNHVEKLDPALIRDGRITYHVKFDRMTKKCADEMLHYYYPDMDLDEMNILDGEFTLAQLGCICKTIFDTDVATSAIKAKRAGP